MINVVETCFERYGASSIFKYNDIDGLIGYISYDNFICFPQEKTIEVDNRTDYIEILTDTIQLIIFNVNDNDLNVLQNFIKSNFENTVFK